MPLPKLNVITYTLTLPSNDKEIIYRPFTVEEERILLTAQESDDSKDILRAMRQIINNCVQTEIDVMELPTFDIEYFFLNIRGKSTGEQIELMLKHDNETNSKGEPCDHRQKIGIDIEQIQVHKDPNHRKDYKLDDNISVTMKYPNIEAISQANVSNFESFVNLIAASIDKIYDKEEIYDSSDHTEKELLEFVYSMNQKQISEVQKFFETMPVLKHTVSYTCAKCKTKETIDIQGFQNFFL